MDYPDFECAVGNTPGGIACPWKNSLNQQDQVSIELVENREPVRDDEMESRSTFCMQRAELDLTYQYCAFYGLLNLDY